MAGMGTLLMGMVADIMVEGTMEVVVTIAHLTTDLQTDQIDQDLNTLYQDQTDPQQCRLDQQQDHQWDDLQLDHQVE